MSKSPDVTLGEVYQTFADNKIADMLEMTFGKARPIEITGENSARIEVSPDIKIPFERVKFETAFVGERDSNGKVRPIENADLPKILADSKSIQAKVKRDKLEKAYRGGNSLPVTLGIVADNGGKGIEKLITVRASLNLKNSLKAIAGELGSRVTRGDNLAELAGEL